MPPYRAEADRRACRRPSGFRLRKRDRGDEFGDRTDRVLCQSGRVCLGLDAERLLHVALRTEGGRVGEPGLDLAEDRARSLDVIGEPPAGEQTAGLLGAPARL